MMSINLKISNNLEKSRNLIIDEEVGTDQFGPYKHNAGQIFVDKASGYIYMEVYTLKKDNDSSIRFQVYLENLLVWYNKYNYTINNLISDCHTISKYFCHNFL
jgi:hypothetical protein